MQQMRSLQGGAMPPDLLGGEVGDNRIEHRKALRADPQPPASRNFGHAMFDERGDPAGIEAPPGKDLKSFRLDSF